MKTIEGGTPIHRRCEMDDGQLWMTTQRDSEFRQSFSTCRWSALCDCASSPALLHLWNTENIHPSNPISTVSPDAFSHTPSYLYTQSSLRNPQKGLHQLCSSCWILTHTVILLHTILFPTTQIGSQPAILVLASARGRHRTAQDLECQT